MDEMKAKASACSNIALAKYWGKEDPDLNIPAVGSVSFTLAALKTTTVVCFDPVLDSDILLLNGTRADAQKTVRVSKFLDLVRSRASLDVFARVESDNNFPTGAGLASSASAFAALAGAASRAANLNSGEKELSILARLGSGSAARSVFGGFVEMQPGERQDGSDSFARQLADENYWDLRFLVIITSRSEKATGSTEGMTHTAKTSPFYKNWIASSAKDIDSVKKAIAIKDFNRLGEISEHSCLKMHGLMMSAAPALFYWTDVTVSVIQATYALRREGIPVYFTIDAGPQVKLITLPPYVEPIEARISTLDLAVDIIHSAAGGGLKIHGIDE